MNSLLVTFQVLFAVLLIAAVLLQPGAKGGGMGSAFGGGGANSAFGARGAAPFLAKATYWLGAGFMASCLLIEVNVALKNRSVLDTRKAAKPAAAAPATPSAPGTPAPPAPAAPAPAK